MPMTKREEDLVRRASIYRGKVIAVLNSCMCGFPYIVYPTATSHRDGCPAPALIATQEPIERVRVFDGKMCRICGCTALDCANCIRRTGVPCSWVEPDLCSACVPVAEQLAELARQAETYTPTPKKGRRP